VSLADDKQKQDALSNNPRLSHGNVWSLLKAQGRVTATCELLRKVRAFHVTEMKVGLRKQVELNASQILSDHFRILGGFKRLKREQCIQRHSNYPTIVIRSTSRRTIPNVSNLRITQILKIIKAEISSFNAQQIFLAGMRSQ
jgi:hypothetical protein